MQARKGTGHLQEQEEELQDMEPSPLQEEEPEFGFRNFDPNPEIESKKGETEEGEPYE